MFIHFPADYRGGIHFHRILLCLSKTLVSIFPHSTSTVVYTSPSTGIYDSSPRETYVLDQDGHLPWDQSISNTEMNARGIHLISSPGLQQSSIVLFPVADPSVVAVGISVDLAVNV